MDRFVVKYHGKNIFSIETPTEVEVAQKQLHQDLTSVENWAVGFCSSWLNYSIEWRIDEYKKENTYSSKTT